MEYHDKKSIEQVYLNIKQNEARFNPFYVAENAPYSVQKVCNTESKGSETPPMLMTEGDVEYFDYLDDLVNDNNYKEKKCSSTEYVFLPGYTSSYASKTYCPKAYAVGEEVLAVCYHLGNEIQPYVYPDVMCYTKPRLRKKLLDADQLYVDMLTDVITQMNVLLFQEYKRKTNLLPSWYRGFLIKPLKKYEFVPFHVWVGDNNFSGDSKYIYYWAMHHNTCKTFVLTKAKLSSSQILIWEKLNILKRYRSLVYDGQLNDILQQNIKRVCASHL